MELRITPPRPLYGVVNVTIPGRHGDTVELGPILAVGYSTREIEVIYPFRAILYPIEIEILERYGPLGSQEEAYERYVEWRSKWAARATSCGLTGDSLMSREPHWFRGPASFFVIKYQVKEGEEYVEVGPTLVSTEDYLIFRDVMTTARAASIDVNYEVVEAYPVGTSELEAVMRFSRDYRQKGTIFDIRRRALAAGTKKIVAVLAAFMASVVGTQLMLDIQAVA